MGSVPAPAASPWGKSGTAARNGGFGMDSPQPMHQAVSTRIPPPHSDQTHLERERSRAPVYPAAKAKPEPKVVEETDDFDAESETEIAAPEVLEDNILHALGGMNENARIFHRLLKISAFDRVAANRIATAIDRAIEKWRSIQSTLEKKGHDNPAERKAKPKARLVQGNATKSANKILSKLSPASLKARRKRMRWTSYMTTIANDLGRSPS